MEAHAEGLTLFVRGVRYRQLSTIVIGSVRVEGFYMRFKVGGVEQTVRFLRDMPAATHARYSTAENIEASVAFNDRRLTAAAAFNCCQGGCDQRELEANLGFHLDRRYSE